MRSSTVATLTLMLLTAFAFGDAAQTQPATATLLGGRIEFAPPDGWTAVNSPQTSDTVAIYLADDKDGYLAIQILPENAAITPAAARKIVGQLGVNHKKAGQEIVEPPEILKDPRFAIKIHERYKTADGKVADETHLYRQVRGRALELDVQSLSGDRPHIDSVQKAGEDMLISTEWKTKKPAKN